MAYHRVQPPNRLRPPGREGSPHSPASPGVEGQAYFVQLQHAFGRNRHLKQLLRQMSAGVENELAGNSQLEHDARLRHVKYVEVQPLPSPTTRRQGERRRCHSYREHSHSR